MRRNFFISFLLLSATLFFAGCDKNEDDAADTISFSDYLKSQPSLSMYATALNKAKLESYINGSGPFTFFAPTNEAFTAAGITTDSLNKMTDGAINYLIQYHIVNAEVTTRDLFGAQYSFARGTQIGNTAATQIFLGTGGDSAYINGTNIINPDNRVSNGVVHVINKFQVPQVLKGTVQSLLSSTGQHSLFIAALTRGGRWAGLTGTGPFTLLAPTDAAMTAEGYTLTSINASTVGRMDSLVRYHYFSGARLFSNDLGDRISPQTALGVNRTVMSSNKGRQIKGNSNTAAVNVVQPNMLGTNGVLHTIDGVLKY